MAERLPMLSALSALSALLLLIAAGMLTACAEHELDLPEYDENQILMTFTITLSETTSGTRADGTPGTWGDEYTAENGNYFESYVDFDKFHALLFKTENGNLKELITEITPLTHSAGETADGYSKIYTFTGIVGIKGETDIEALQTIGENARLMIIANADYAAAKGEEVRTVEDMIFTRSNLKSIPMWGVKDVDLSQLRAGSAMRVDDLTLLRSMAKVRVTLGENIREQVRITGMELSRHNEAGYVAPGKWDEIDDTRDIPFSETLRVPGGENGGNVNNQNPLIFNSHIFEEGNVDFTDDGIEFYVPEIENSSEESRKISLKVTYIVDGSEEIGIIYFSEYDEDGKLEPKADNWDIRRNHIYDFTIIGVQDELKIRFSVVDWQLVDIPFYLNGQIYLHLDRTEISIEAGQTVGIWCDTNGEPTIYDCPKVEVNGRNLDLYVMKMEGDSLKVSVNPAIPYNRLEEYVGSGNLVSGINNYFYIKSGNLIKKIDVKPFRPAPFLTVTPQNNTIDVKENIVSGMYSGLIDIVVETNLDSFTLDRGTFTVADSNLKLYLVENGVEKELTDWGQRFYPDADGRKTFRMRYSGLNSNAEIWQNSGAFEFKVKYEMNGNARQEPVTLGIIPMNTEYMIHVRLNNYARHPHIYIYQCLELPADYKGNLNGTSLASKPIGFEYNDGNGNPFQEAALEYSFTGGIVFKGWDYPSNRSEIYNDDGTPKDLSGGRFSHGFFVFSGITGTEHRWAPASDNSNDTYYKGIDYYKDYRNLLLEDKNNGSAYCNDCITSNKESYPGIALHPEGNDWWYVTVPGIASPGKTLIIISDAKHDGADATFQFPGSDSKVGLPLFDFPSKEGWIDLTDDGDKEFKSYKP